jgi:signal transduction histidine kinase
VEVKEHPEKIGQYWPRYWRRSVFLVICIQFLAVLITIGALIFTGVIRVDENWFWIFTTAVLASIIGMNLLLLPILTEPLKQLVAAIASSVGEHSTVPPPNPNIKRYRTNGIQPLLRAVYASGTAAAPSSEAAAQNSSEAVPAAIKAALDFDAVFNQGHTGVVVFDQDHHVLYHNAAAPIKVQEDGSSSLDLLFYTEQSFDSWLEACEKKKIRANQTWKRIADKPPGEEDRRIFDVVASYQKESIASTVLLFVDRTGDYEPEDDALNFISFAAHELRGPITVIRGYLDTLMDEMDGDLKGDQRELFERLVVSANRLSSFINNILNTSKYDRRHFNVRLIETTVNDVYKVVADDMELRARSQHRLLSVSLPPELPTIAADPGSLSEVFANLIDNAIKYSNEGGSVEVSAEVHGTMVEVQVADHGIGMPANVVSNLFHKFYRSHRSRETVAGTGIGLYISKAIMETHGGSMAARSIEGMGSTFTFGIPTYASVADKLKLDNSSQQMITHNNSGGWIRNHGAIKG